jgi:hypothetical protein
MRNCVHHISAARAPPLAFQIHCCDFTDGERKLGRTVRLYLSHSLPKASRGDSVAEATTCSLQRVLEHMVTHKRSVQLSADLCEMAETRYHSTFGSIEQLLESVLSELLRDDPAKLNQAETQLVEQRLRDLGYL